MSENLFLEGEGRWRCTKFEENQICAWHRCDCQVCWTHTQKYCRSPTTSTSPHPGPGKTIPSVIFQWTWKVFTYSLLREKWKTRMDKSNIATIWTNSWVWVSHPWISTWSLSKGKPRFKSTCKSNRWPTTQTLWCGWNNISKSVRTCSEWLDNTWQYLVLHLRSSWKRWTKRTHTHHSHSHTTYSLTDTPIYMGFALIRMVAAFACTRCCSLMTMTWRIFVSAVFVRLSLSPPPIHLFMVWRVSSLSVDWIGL